MTDRVIVESESCPKTVWVLSALSDDELCEVSTELPPGLSFHLGRCSSCRALADRLQRVTRSLQSLSISEPPDDLEDRAEARLRAALARCTSPTGRVNVADEGYELRESDIPAWRRWFHRANLAVAAVLSLTMAGLYLSYRQRQLVDPPVVQQLHPVPTDRDFEFVVNAARTVRPTAGGQVANAVKSAKRNPLPRRHHSHVEAAFADDPGAVQYGVILPDPATRGVHLGLWFDKPVDIGSTMTFQKDN